MIFSALLSLITVVLLRLTTEVRAVGCFVCDSLNGTSGTSPYFACGDPFVGINPNSYNNSYVPDCMDGRKDVIGLFPARYCVKMIGSRWSPETSHYIYLYIRRCTLDSLGNQNGNFVWGGHSYKGSILTCDYDACNASHSRHESFALISSAILMLGYLRSTVSTIWTRDVRYSCRVD